MSDAIARARFGAVDVEVDTKSDAVKALVFLFFETAKGHAYDATSDSTPSLGDDGNMCTLVVNAVCGTEWIEAQIRVRSLDTGMASAVANQLKIVVSCAIYPAQAEELAQHDTYYSATGLSILSWIQANSAVLI